MPILSKDNKIGINREKTIELYSINSLIHISFNNVKRRGNSDIQRFIQHFI